MAIGAFLPLALFLLIGGGVGFRLIGLWRRTRQLPELSLGGGLLVVTLSMPLTALGRVPAFAMEPSGRILFTLGLLAIGTGVGAIVFFHYWVFRRQSSWGRVFFAAICLLLAGSLGFMAWCNATGDGVDAIKTTMRPGTLTLLGTIALCFAWGAAESLGYRRALLRQQALGLGDPVVANRFLLWGAAGATSTLLVSVIALCAVRGMTIMREPLPLAAMAACGTAMSAAWALTFFAPPWYLAFVRERAERPS